MTDHESATALAPMLPAVRRAGEQRIPLTDPARSIAPRPVTRLRLLMPRCPNCLDLAPESADPTGPALG
ncbi:hypothetical protein F4553_006113 [Allocatelliglobosispora scoriae]|uniref:Uncharacterized protein n=1 Tax=Allocatelliglobosispora scoriae TaxID=643052 RepID=A0A841C003_9ACTN|nr:hypothetical protein [Allocatelliglobosispora scoriae]MBB5872679.1 hypothetical protein [Allocatelliglobosispora scoriae]